MDPHIYITIANLITTIVLSIILCVRLFITGIRESECCNGLVRIIRSNEHTDPDGGSVLRYSD